MAAQGKRASAAQAPADLSRKRPALVANRDDDADLDRLVAEAAAESEAEEDGSIVVQLVTDFGKADIRVPPLRKWRSLAKNALFSREDDMAWAAQTLSFEDAQAWMRLNPTGDEAAAFFDEWGRLTGQKLGEALASRRQSSGRTHGR